MGEPRDDLEAMVAERTARNPAFPALVAAAERRRELLHELRDARKRAHMSRAAVAARMGTSESAIARLENGELDARVSTLARFAEAVGLDLALVPARRT